MLPSREVWGDGTPEPAGDRLSWEDEDLHVEPFLNQKVRRLQGGRGVGIFFGGAFLSF